MDDKELLEKTKNLVQPIYAKIKKWTHGWLHILVVVKAARDLATMEGADPVMCQVAAYCHDLGRLEEEEKSLVNPVPGSPSQHAIMSVGPTKEVLEKVGISGQDAADIIEAVKIHNIRKYTGENKIALILQDADRTDGFGKFAILRFAVFNCGIDLPEPKGEVDVDNLLLQVKGILKNDPAKRRRMIETLKYVFGWCDELANTKSLKKYVAEGYKFNQDYLLELEGYENG